MIRRIAMLSILATLAACGGGYSSSGSSDNVTVTLETSRLAVPPGEAFTLSWESTNATSCTASGAWTGAKATSGSESHSQSAEGSYTYTLSCTRPGVPYPAQTSVEVVVSDDVPAIPTVTMQAASDSNATNSRWTITWSTTNALSCVASGAWTGDKGTSGSYNVAPAATASTYALSCSGVSGTTPAETSVMVPAASGSPPAVPTLTINSSRGTVTAGGSTTISWQTANTTSCTASGAWSGSKATGGGSESITLSTPGDYPFTLNCAGNGGTTPAEASTVVHVVASTPSAPTVSLHAESTATANTWTISWSSTHATSCVASGAWSGARATSGSSSVALASSPSTYRMTCSGANGTTPAEASVTLPAKSS